MAQKTVSGSCACGNISYTSTAPPEHLDYCYCVTCQQISGAPFMAWMGIPIPSLRWKIDSEPIKYRSNLASTGTVLSERTCCSKCGCNILLQYYCYPDKSHIAASTIRQNDFEPLRLECHIFTKSVPEWHVVPDDGVKRYHEFPDDFNARLEAYLQEQKKT